MEKRFNLLKERKNERERKKQAKKKYIKIIDEKFLCSMHWSNSGVLSKDYSKSRPAQKVCIENVRHNSHAPQMNQAEGNAIEVREKQKNSRRKTTEKFDYLIRGVLSPEPIIAPVQKKFGNGATHVRHSL